MPVKNPGSKLYMATLLVLAGTVLVRIALTDLNEQPVPEVDLRAARVEEANASDRAVWVDTFLDEELAKLEAAGMITISSAKEKRGGL
ncbi:MAG: hypothetical protein KAJ19_08975 [Gammaproteobacteria bacterium]|nr:hypothetical protein [Gammaproteobacteria bacterium]